MNDKAEMSTLLPRRFQSIAFLSALAVFGFRFALAADEATPADEPDKKVEEPADPQAKARMDYMTHAMQKYSIILDGNDEKLAVVDPKAMLRWSNPVSNVADGILAVFATGPGARPAVIAQYHCHTSGFEVHEFAAVHPGSIQMMRGSSPFWKPQDRYGKFEKLEGAPKPAETAALRLVQMKRIADRFVVNDDFRSAGQEPVRQPLRLMPRPVYRYGQAEGEILDGAAFSFVLGTNPEATLLLEIHRDGDATTWEYALFPMTIYGLDAELDGKSVWKKPEALVFGNPASAHYAGPYTRDSGEASMLLLLPKPE